MFAIKDIEKIVSRPTHVYLKSMTKCSIKALRGMPWCAIIKMYVCVYVCIYVRVSMRTEAFRAGTGLSFSKQTFSTGSTHDGCKEESHDSYWFAIIDI